MAARKVPVEFSEWRPDIATLDTQFASEVENVFAGVNSYLPFPSLLPFTTTPLPGKPCGLFAARTTNGDWRIYGGTPTALYVFLSDAWADVSRIANPTPPGLIPYSVANGDLWSFEQSGHHLVAVNAANEPQWVDIDIPTDHFVNLPGDPPKATNVRQVGDFLFLSGLPSSNRKIIWSGINDPTHWIIGLSLCDEQEFPDGGPVMGIGGAEIGYVVQERAIRTLQFLPGDVTFIFNFSRVLHDRGSISKYGFASLGNVLYFAAEDGFYSITGQQVTPIGADKVNEWFINPNNSDVGRRNVVQCIAGVNKPRVVWSFHSFSASPTYDRQIIFDWSNGRWAKASVAAYVWALMASLGIGLDTNSAEVNDALLDTPPTPAALSLDSFAYVGGRPLIGALNPDYLLSTLSGPNLEATMETAEVHLAPGQRAFVNQVYPLDDAASDAPGTISTGTRERLQGGAPSWTPPVEIEQSVGSAFVMTSARLHRFRRFIPFASTWTHAQGLIVDAQADGEGVNL